MSNIRISFTPVSLLIYTCKLILTHPHFIIKQCRQFTCIYSLIGYIIMLISTKLYDLSAFAYILHSPQTRIHRIKKPPADKTAVGYPKNIPHRRFARTACFMMLWGIVCSVFYSYLQIISLNRRYDLRTLQDLLQSDRR